MKFFGLECKKLDSETIDDIEYELWTVLSSDEGIVRIFDAESGDLVTVTKFPTFQTAAGAFFDTLKLVNA